MNLGIGGVEEVVEDGLQRVLGVLIETIELCLDPCGAGHGGLWDLLAGGILESCGHNRYVFACGQCS